MFVMNFELNNWTQMTLLFNELKLHARSETIFHIFFFLPQKKKLEQNCVFIHFISNPLVDFATTKNHIFFYFRSFAKHNQFYWLLTNGAVASIMSLDCCLLHLKWRPLQSNKQTNRRNACLKQFEHWPFDYYNADESNNISYFQSHHCHI